MMSRRLLYVLSPQNYYITPICQYDFFYKSLY